MMKSILAAAALAAVATAASAQTAPATPPADHAAHADHAALPTITSSIKDLLANPATAAVLEKHLPGVSQHPALPQFQDMTLSQVAPLSGGAVTPAIIEAIDTDLKALPAT
ncbi:hypothetical protein [Brevundimonas subvibrioides]|uniref:Uncharacterized protein n=1 Tax=Brevundimonas subvibrioides (strain ATCC 15264 / DSM 4735 / LMG 14903 / NBRC 16000 / CB 81) TaxID=633149 RepID=D9QHI6_BRESC|nr:hypothetical protein [Brevundimonas subvibrioides]ADL01152.1 conserved hypothetical protein [Brevundimonas subvibrioides ATCC 15264]